MAPFAPSVTTSGSASTGLTTSSTDNPRSLKNYDVVDGGQVTAVTDVLNSIDFKHCDVCLVTVPNGFPREKLSEVPIAEGEVNDMKVGADYYTVRDTASTNTVLPIPNSHSRYSCRKIRKSLSVTKSLKCTTSTQLHFISRPEFPQMSENLIERFVPFGYKVTESSKIVESQTKKKHKKHKRTLQHEDSTFDQTALESPSVKKKKRRKVELATLDEVDTLEDSVDIESNVAAETRRLQKMAKKARKAAKKAKKAKKKKGEE